jgi:endo-1,4-beta-xylanase
VLAAVLVVPPAAPAGAGGNGATGNGQTLCRPTCHGQPLRQAARKAGLLMGAAVPPAVLDDPLAVEILARDFSSVTSENHMKWPLIHPAPGVWNFEEADRLVAFAQEHDMGVRGHTFLWSGGNGTPAWVRAITNPDQLRAVITDHMRVLLERYDGVVDRWDVVNEPFQPGTGNLVGQFRNVLGPDYIAWAFETAHAIDPDAELVLNEALVEYVDPTRTALISLVTDLVNRGVPITGVGLQMHGLLGKPAPGVVQNMVQAFTDLGLDVEMTELDAQIPPIFYAFSTPPAPGTELQYQAEHYDQVVSEFLAGGGDDITTWGFTDRYSWLNTGGRNAQGLLWDVNYQPKPSAKAVRDALREHAASL